MPYLSVLLEFTGGTALASEMGSAVGAYLTGFAVGWSGISVFAQCKAFSARAGIRLRRTAVCKFIQGILTGTAAAVYYTFFYKENAVPCLARLHADVAYYALTAEILLLVLFCFLPFLFRDKKSGPA